ncbi:MAG: hypothetical protein JO352_06260 [Chloroflexi bacterium]|nr:hypothetical protein [Chloroflexota bacterium]MBV9602163.1 hypothetical protein [Chloroflexota bacterium]
MHEPNRPPSHFEDAYPDEVDRLFARLDRAPVPDDLTARVLSSTVERTNATRAVLAWPWMVACLLALGLLTIAGYELGASLAATDGLELVAAIFTDAGLLATAPGDVLAALNEVVPWTLVVMAGVSGALLILAAGNIVSRAPGSLRPHKVA